MAAPMNIMKLGMLSTGARILTRFPAKRIVIDSNLFGYYRSNRFICQSVCNGQLKNHQTVNMTSLVSARPMPIMMARVRSQIATQTAARCIASATTDDDVLRKEMNKLTDSFMEAKELLEDARESLGSVYFSEDLLDADKAVEKTLAEYQSLLSSLSDDQKQNVVRSIGLRMEELKAQQNLIRESLRD